MFKPIFLAAAALILSIGVQAQEVNKGVSDVPANSTATTSPGPRIGLAQPDAMTPPLLGRMQLNDPLIQQKYLNDPDLLRFLRATYSEACVRGNLIEMAKAVKSSDKAEVSEEMKKALSAYLSSQRIWKMSSFELEALFNSSYIQTAFYCDCIMKEVTDLDLVNPKKSMKAIKDLRIGVSPICQDNAVEKAKKYKETLPERYQIFYKKK